MGRLTKHLELWPNHDPIGERGGINLYSYVGNSPLRYADPLGLQVLPPSQGTYGAWNDTSPTDLSDWNNELNHYEPGEPNGDNPIDWILSFFSPPPTPEQAEWDQLYGPNGLHSMGPGPFIGPQRPKWHKPVPPKPHKPCQEGILG
jgi:uncharacterized protein RhaS with RHS repeats